MIRYASPLRYPGGKGRLTGFFADLLEENHIDGTFVEPFAGGAGVACGLLLAGKVRHAVLNDLDGGVWSFWRTLATDPQALVDGIEAFPFTEETARRNPGAARSYWRHVHDRYFLPHAGRDTVRHAVDFLLLNRMNVSGIVTGGPIGGLDQTGRYNIASRLNRRAIVTRIRRLATVRDRLTVTNMDAVRLLDQCDAYGDRDNMLVFLDPPYVVEGKRLYGTADAGLHARLARTLNSRGIPCPWVLTYDRTPEIGGLYGSGTCVRHEYSLDYSANRHRRAGEWMYTSRGLAMPSASATRITRKE